MTVLLIIGIALVLMPILYLLALRCRNNHPLLRKLRKWNYAHRGLHNDKVPENSMTAFRLALEKGYGIELDLHLLADGNLAVMHDSSLLRTAGVDVPIESLNTQQLSEYRLLDTQEEIPTFEQVLQLFQGKAPMIIELKSANGNHDALTQTACRMLENYDGLYCIESFDPRCIRWLKKNRPDIVRGQLASNSLKEKDLKIPLILRFWMTNLLTNFWNVPDFIAYCFSDRNQLSVLLSHKVWKVQNVAWTIKTREDYDAAVEEGWIPIFEGFEP
ncbi:MAG: glycerophosphodiester phosphodiesterase [Ruminococcaceae bacterium]|nr:glycerophosphodiester phosphodiesterase [Oscillospiraceae bacterium]